MKPHNFTQKDIEILYLAMLQLIKNKKLNLVALMQNTLRKIVIMKDGHIENKKSKDDATNFLIE
jgi:hypothetical protein